MEPVRAELSPEATETLYQIADLTDLPPERALLQAIAVARVIAEEVSRGSKILIKRRRDETLRELDFGEYFGRRGYAP